jgi:hypothetical protein
VNVTPVKSLALVFIFRKYTSVNTVTAEWLDMKQSGVFWLNFVKYNTSEITVIRVMLKLCSFCMPVNFFVLCCVVYLILGQG